MSSPPAPFLRLFGPPVLELGPHERVPWVAQRPHQALAWLACTRQWTPRDTLAHWLWPEHEPAAARRNLRKVLTQARTLTGAAALEQQGENLRWAVDSDHARFDAACDAGDAGSVLAALPGLLMEGLEGGLSPVALDWLANERQRLAQRWRDLALRRLPQLAAEPAAAVTLCERLLVLDAFDDSAVIALAQARAALGQSAEALRLLEDYQRRLRDEFAIEPGAALQAARDALRTPSGDTVPGALTSLTSAAAPATAPDEDFIGRRGELQQLLRLLQQPACRALTINGPGGIGKSRLATRAAAELAPLFPDGVHWLPTEDLNHADQVAQRLCAALELAPQDHQPDLWRQLAEHAAPRRLLWVLDSTEHLPGLGATLAPVLAAAPALKLINTSRTRLGVPGEQLLPLEGFAVPDLDEHDPEVLRAFDAVRLFEARALAVAPAFRLEEQAADVAALVATVEGLPLAIELAAPWVRLLPVAEIVAELRRSTQLLDDDGAHRGARALRDSFNHSWRLLPPAERQALARLAVLPDEFDREMAREVADAGLALLAALADKSLLHVRPEGRFGLHPMVRHYALEHVADASALQQRHAAFVARWLETGGAAAQPRALTRNITHLRSAWQFALERREVALVRRFTRPLSSYFESRGLAAAGIELMAAAVAAFDGEGDTELPALAAALRSQATLEYRAGRLDDAETHSRRALRLAQRLKDAVMTMGSLNTLGLTLWLGGRFTQARPYFAEALRTARLHGEQRGIFAFLSNLAMVQTSLGEYAEAAAGYDEVLVGRERGEGRATTLNNAANARRALGQFDAAAALLAEALQICEQEDLPDVLTFVRLNLGVVALDRGDTGAARRHLEQAAASLADAGGVIHAEVHLWLAVLEMDSDDTPAARLQLLEALGPLERSDLIALRLRWAVVLVRWLLRRQRTAEAAALLQWADAQAGLSALDRRDSLRGLEARQLKALAEPAAAPADGSWPGVLAWARGELAR